MSSHSFTAATRSERSRALTTHRAASHYAQTIPVSFMRALALLCALAIILTIALSSTPARAEDPSQEALENWPLSVNAVVTPQGQLEVTESFNWDLDNVKAPFVRALPLFVPRLEQSWRKYEYTNFTATSSTDDLELTVTDDAHQLLVRMDLSAEEKAARTADKDFEPSTLDIEFSYVVHGALSVQSPTDASSNELFWAPLASGGTARTDLDFLVTAPQDMQHAQCSVLLDDGSLLGWSDALDREPELENELEGAPIPLCTTHTEESRVSARNLNRYSTVIVRANYPLGTLTEDSAISVDEPEQPGEDLPGTAADEFDPTWSENIDFGLDQGVGWLGPLLAALAAIALGLGFAFFMRRKPDLRYSATSHGDSQAAVELHEQVARAEPNTVNAIAVSKVKKDLTGPARTDIPHDLPSGLTGGLWALELSWNDIWAIIADLASRGHLTVSVNHSTYVDENLVLLTRVGKPGADRPASTEILLWTLTRTLKSEALNKYEQALVDALFDTETEVQVESLHSAFAPQLLEVLAHVGQELKDRDFVIAPVDNAVSRRARRMQRTPLGRAYAEHLDGIAVQLGRVDQDFAEFHEAASTGLFEKYLPLAIALGKATQWAASFDSNGIEFALPQWFVVSPKSSSSTDAVDTPTSYSELIGLWRNLLA